MNKYMTKNMNKYMNKIMNKRIYLLGVVLAVSTFITLARTPQEAAEVASTFWNTQQTQKTNKKLTKNTIAQPVELSYTLRTADDQENALYVFNTPQKGFVIVSAEEDARDVLGYSENNSFDANNVPPALIFWMQMYADEIAAYKAAEMAGTLTNTKQSEEEYNYTPVEPILGDVKWGQSAPFNDLAPIVDNKKCPAGCVATALAQIMYVHKHPEKGTGMKSVTTKTHGLMLSADFSQTTYDWENMLPTYVLGEYNQAQASAVATLLYHVGIASDMDYKPGASGTQSSSGLLALMNFFGYDKGMEMLLKDYMAEKTILDKLSAELQAGRPAYVSGSTIKNEGHAFVCDGMQANGYLHINWGWNGQSDGYFALSALKPETQGTGGSLNNLAFTEYVDLCLGIQPDKGGKSKPILTTDRITLGGFSSSTPTNVASPITFNLDVVMNSGYVNVRGNITYHLLNKKGENAQTMPTGTDISLAPGYYRTNTVTTMSKSGVTVPDGQYYLTLMLEQNGMEVPILLKDVGQIYIPILVKDGKYTLNNTPEEEEEPSAVEDVQTANMVYLYDIFGRMVDSQSSKMERAWNVPANGIYIQKQGEKTSKVSL